MAGISKSSRILVTGANGYIAIWVVYTLLEQGYTVRGTVRTEEKRKSLLSLFKDSVSEGRFEVFLVPDMTITGAYDEVVNGLDAIVHVASPTTLGFDAINGSNGFEPVVRAMVGIFESALKHAGPQLKRIVATSSMSTTPEAAKNKLFDEATLSGESSQEITLARIVAKYRPTKTKAEKAAWKFVEDHKTEINWDLTFINPSVTFGPILGEATSPDKLGTSAAILYQVLMQNKLPALGYTHLWWADVRDVALAHVRALEVPEAGGQYFVTIAGAFDWQDWFDSANELGLPGLSFPQRGLSQGVSQGNINVFDSDKVKKILGIGFRDRLTTVRDSIKDFQSRGW